MRKIFFFVMFVLLINVIIALKDFDNDGMPDSWEKKYNLKYDVNDANEDPDNDGLTNLQEYEKGTNPLAAEKDKGNIFNVIFGFLGENITKILIGVAVLVILYFVFKISVELIRLKKKKKIKNMERGKIIPRQVYIPTTPKKVIRPVNNRNLNKFKRKHKQITHLTYHFEEKEGIEEDLSPLPYSFSSKIKELKEGFKPEKKPAVKKEEKGSVFERLPKRK